MARRETTHQSAPGEQQQLRCTARLLAEAIVELLETADQSRGQQQSKQDPPARQGRAEGDPEREAGPLGH